MKDKKCPDFWPGLKKTTLVFTNGAGLTKGQFELMWVDQNGACAICGTSMEYPDRLHIDHDHSTGAVRGLLCPSCNAGLGFFKDDIRLLAGAIVYLEG